MIKNERQYRITKTQASRFAEALKTLESEAREGVHPLLRKAQIDAVKSQHADLDAQLRDYEALREQRPAVIEAETLDELPSALIRARIALGLSHKELAERMGLKEQQIQRYEATDYGGATLSVLRDVAKALGARISERVFLPVTEPTREALYARLDAVGIDTEFLLDRLMPTDVVTELESVQKEDQVRAVVRASQVLGRIFGWRAEQLYGAAPLAFPEVVLATARLKLPGGPHGRRLHAYLVYAHYIATVVANACQDLPTLPLTLDAGALRQLLLARAPSLDLKSVLHVFWDHGVPVIPLQDSAAFHGACWRVSGRNVIVVKQRSKFLARWVFDLLHEWHHAAQNPDDPNHTWIEDGDVTSARRTSPEERAANSFAGNLVLNNRAEELVNACVNAAKGRIQLLKSVIGDVARNAGVVVDHLANYLAWRLSLQGENWWGTANNLQTQVGDPFSIASEVFYERFDFGRIDPVDQKLVSRALLPAGGTQ